MLTRICTSKTLSSAIPLFTRVSYSQDISLQYLDKDIDPKVEDAEAIKTRILRGIHPEIVQSDAFKKASFVGFRNNSTMELEGQHPAITKTIKEANEIDDQLQAVDDDIASFNPIFNITRAFEYASYRKGDEDSLLKTEIDWNFYKAIIPDTSFVDSIKVAYEESIEECYKESLEEGVLPDDFEVLERFQTQMEEHFDSRWEPYFATIEDDVYDLKNIPDTIEEIIHDWDQVKLWVSAPRVAAAIQNKVDNNIWEMEDEHDWIEPEKIPQ